jgi:Na+-translocating ferredoxin:NAD+ oxidoreductase RnfC subunit
LTISEKILNAGVIGAGGAGFPTDVKLKASAINYIANGAECEPLVYKDRFLLKNYPDEIISGLSIAMAETGAEKGYIAIKEKNKEALKAVVESIKEKDNLKIVPLPDIYPSGDEYLLTYFIINKRVPQGGIPIDVDTIVNNIETLYNIHLAIKENKPVINKYISVVGKVKNPGIYRVPVGMIVGDILKKAEIVDDKFTILANGVMMGKRADMKTPVLKTTSAIFVLDPLQSTPVNYSLTIPQIKIRARSACEHCRLCTDMCPRYLLGYDIEPHKIIRSFAFSTNETEYTRGVFNCCECGICEIYACPMELSPRMVCTYLKDIVKEKSSENIKDIHPERENRLIPLKRLMLRTGIVKHRLKKLPLYELDTDRVVIPFAQNFGNPPKAIVKKGEKVNKGEVIAVPDGKYSTTTHASISGCISGIDGDIIEIRR